MQTRNIPHITTATKVLSYKYVQNGIQSHGEFLNFFLLEKKCECFSPAQQVVEVCFQWMASLHTDQHQQVKLTDQICVCAQL